VGRPLLELADVMRAHADEFITSEGARLTPARRRVLKDLMRCRTAELGGHVERCVSCGETRNAYNSCRNRHCPKCQATRAAAWVDAREADLLPVQYFHVVFTMPEELAAVALQNKKEVYEILFRAASETLLEIAKDPKHLGAKVGFLAVLHTWTQELRHHPHVHCVVPGGGLSPEGDRWIACRPGFFLPVRVLSAMFRGKFLALLDSAHRRGLLRFQGSAEELRRPAAFASVIAEARGKKWVVYAKRPFAGPAAVLKYLARYTHRVAISNQRLVSLRDGQVSFRCRARKGTGRKRTVTLPACEFLRRFLRHVLPSGFVRIRHFGLLANRTRRANLVRCRALLSLEPVDVETSVDATSSKAALPVAKCPRCGETEWGLLEMLSRSAASSGFGKEPPDMIESHAMARAPPRRSRGSNDDR